LDHWTPNVFICWKWASFRLFALQYFYFNLTYDQVISMQNNHINKALLRVTTMDSAEFHEAVRLLSAQRSSLLATDHRKVLPGVIGLWRCETDSSREGHHVRCVLQSIINRDTSLILYTNHYRPRSKTRRDARLFTSRRTRQAKITHLSPLHLPPPPNSALTQAWSSHVIYCIEP
jgi:hypothetical protein